MFLHTLKGNAGTLGLTELEKEAARLEKLCIASETQTNLPEVARPLSQLCKLAQESLTLAIAYLQDAGGASQQLTMTTDREGEELVSQARLTDTVEALRKLEALLTASDFNALQIFSELRGSWVCLPADFEDAMDEALQALDLEKARDLCGDALQRLRA